MEIEKETELFKDIVLHFTTLIIPFTLREVSMCFLLHLNEDFDDDLLMEAVDLIAWLTRYIADIINNINSLIYFILQCRSPV